MTEKILGKSLHQAIRASRTDRDLSQYFRRCGLSKPEVDAEAGSYSIADSYFAYLY